MLLLWMTYWPMVVAALVAGLAVGVLYHGKPGREPNRPTRLKIIAIGVGAVLVATALFHGPFGAADRLAGGIERKARETLVHYEMPQIAATLVRSPMRRTLYLAGAADDFQRAELVRMFSELNGVADVRWNHRQHLTPLPLLLEAELMALVGFLAGLLLAYLVELRRRGRQWDRY